MFFVIFPIIKTRFVNRLSYLDIAGVAQTKTESDHAPAGATGWGVMTLDTLVKNNFERG